MTEKTPREAPKTMPETPEAFLAFVAWPEKYLNETDAEFEQRQSLCGTLGKRYAEHMKQKLNVPTNKSKIWVPGMK